ncbi:MAG: ATPase P [Thermodesulfobacteriota bacterium]|nr:ATPase P [Thermodesulfobacteriota bacterium]
MLEVDIPGYGELTLAHLVMDYNGTMACDGRLIDGVAERLDALTGLTIHVLTADTFGRAGAELAGTPAELSILPEAAQDRGKLAYIKQLGADQTVAIGNGRNDRLMLAGAALGIALIQKEGACVATVNAADMVCPDILSALSLLSAPRRLIAGLRS